MESALESAASPRRVLTIQSHCVRGYVGNKAAVFPLQLLGAHRWRCVPRTSSSALTRRFPGARRL